MSPRLARLLAFLLPAALAAACDGAGASPDSDADDAEVAAPDLTTGPGPGDASLTGEAGPPTGDGDAAPPAADALPPPVGDAVVSPPPSDAGAPPPPPVGDAVVPPPPSDAVAPPPVDAGPPLPDAAPPLPPPTRVCCLADADCEEGRRCDGGRCWNPIPTPPCDAAHPCAGGSVCEGGACQPACGCVEGSCPAETACITDDQSCGVCAPVDTLCTPACDRDLTGAEWAYLAQDPLQEARPLVFEGTLVSDARMPGGVGRRLELEGPDGMRRGFAYVLPAGLALPFELGETVRADISGLQGDGNDARASLAGPEGVRLMVVQRRGAAPTQVLGLPFHVEDLGCGPTLIGNCLQAMPATLVFDVAGSRSPVAHTGDRVTLLGWDVRVARVYRDDNACEPALHDLYANFAMVRAAP